MRRLDKEKQKTSARGDIRHSGSPGNNGSPNLALGRTLLRSVPALGRMRNRDFRGRVLSPQRRRSPEDRSQGLTLRQRLGSWRLSGADPLDEPVEDSRPDLVLADQVLNSVFKVGIVIDLDNDDRAVGFLDVDAVKAG